jgi:alpha-L-arabinofuranosidase
VPLTVDLAALDGVRVLDAQTMSDEDSYAKNTLQDRERVSTHRTESVVVGETTITVALPPVSWTAIELA